MRRSHIGKQWVRIPKALVLKRQGSTLYAQGPLGKSSLTFPTHWKLQMETHRIQIHAPKEDARLHGTLRIQLQNLLQGLVTGYRQQVQLVGVGYRVAVENRTLNLKLGFSHPVILPIPKDIQVDCPKNNLLDLHSWDAQALGQFISQIRRLRPPDPYKGKGVVIRGEVIRKKQGKI